MALSFVGNSIESFMNYIKDYDKKNPPIVKMKLNFNNNFALGSSPQKVI